MLTDTAPGRTAAVNFALRSVAWSLGLFGVLRLGWAEAHLVSPLTHAQAGLAAKLFGRSALPVEVTLACSGADALTLCLGAILAYPALWRRRLAGAAGAIVLILTLNTIRIGTLGIMAASPWFNTLHVYVWPAVLTVAIAGYVFGWMQLAGTRRPRVEVPVALEPAISTPQLTRRFVLYAAAFVVVFVAASPLYLESSAVLALAGFVARSAAVTLGVAGVHTHAAGNVLWTARGPVMVTQECISTPLIPIYLAAICAGSRTWPRLVLGAAATLPLFIALGILRLLVVVLPDAAGTSPLFFVHAFYQLLLGAVVVFLAALWKHGSRTALRHAAFGVIVGVLCGYLFGPVLTRVVTHPMGGAPADSQGAIAFLPAFQLGLYLALWIAAFVAVGWKRFLAGFAMLEITQAAGLLALNAFATYAGLTAQVRDIRGWAVAGPILVVATVVNVARPPR